MSTEAEYNKCRDMA